MTAARFKMGIVKSVVQNHIAFRFFSSTAFRSLNGEMAEKLKEIHILIYYFTVSAYNGIKGPGKEQRTVCYKI